MADQWERLPEECWESVFDRLGHNRHLEAPSLVCKRFLSISNRLRSSLTVSDPTVLLHGGISGLLRRFQQLKRIDFVEFHGDVDRLLREIGRSGLNLEVLSLSKQRLVPVEGMKELGAKVKSLRILICSRLCFLQDSDLNAIADSFPLLEELDISYPEQDFSSLNKTDPAEDYYAVSGSFPGTVSDAGIAMLSSKLQKLCRIDVSGNHFISDRSLLSLSSKCIFLREIGARDCSLISEIGVALAIRHNSHLISLSVNGSKIPSSASTSSSSFTIESALISARSLCTLDFSQMIISDDLLSSIIQADLPLMKLSLSRCRGFTFAGISSLLCKYCFLNYLDIEGAAFLTDESMLELSQNLHDVIFINLNSCSNLTNSTFFLLMKTCLFLEEIRMESTSLGKQDFPSDLKNFQLQTLKLSWNKCLNDETLKRIAMICPNFRSLDISHCWSITGEGIGFIGMNCCEIKMLGVNGCGRLSNFGTSFGFSKLEVLYAAGSGIDDEGLRKIWQSCRSLLRLDLDGCLGVTAEGVRELVANSKGLKEISLKKCCNVGSDVVAWMVFSRPSLRKLIPPCDFVSTEKQREFFLRHGCWVLDH